MKAFGFAIQWRCSIAKAEEPWVESRQGYATTNHVDIAIPFHNSPML